MPVAGVAEHDPGPLAHTVLGEVPQGGVEHRLQMSEVRRVDRDLGREDDLLLVHGSLRVVPAGRGALRAHHPGVRIGEVITPSGMSGAMNGLVLPRSTLPFVSRADTRQRS